MFSRFVFAAIVFVHGCALAQTDSTFVQDLARYKPHMNSIPAQRVYPGDTLSVAIQAYTDQGTPPKLSFNWQHGGTMDVRTRRWEWVPQEIHIGTHPIIFTATDTLTGQSVNQAVLVEVLRVEHAPSVSVRSSQAAKDGYLLVSEGEELALVITAEDRNSSDVLRLGYHINNDPDARLDGARFEVSGHGATFFWIPTHQQARSGLVRLVFWARDPGGLRGEARLTVRVKDVAHAPVFAEGPKEYYVDEDELLRFTVQATDDDGETLRYRLHTTDIKRSDCLFDNSTGRFQWTPTYEYVSRQTEYRLVFSASDFTHTVYDTVLVKVDPKNYPPVITAIPERSIRENEMLQLTLKVSDKNGDENLRFEVEAPELDGYQFNPDNRTLVWTPDFAYVDGTDKRVAYIKFRVSDRQFSDEQMVKITVLDRRDPRQTLVSYAQAIKNGRLMHRRLTAMDENLAHTLQRKHFWNNFFDVATIAVGAFSGIASSSLASDKLQEAAAPIAGAATTLIGVRAILDQSSDKLYDLRQRVLLLKGSLETMINNALIDHGETPELSEADTQAFQDDLDQLQRSMRDMEAQFNGLVATYQSLPVKTKKK